MLSNRRGRTRPHLMFVDRGSEMTQQPTLVTKDDQALKIFQWAAGAASLRMA